MDGKIATDCGVAATFPLTIYGCVCETCDEYGRNSRNEPTVINDREYSGHALDRMQERGLMPSTIENTIDTGTQFTTRAGTTGFYDAVNNLRVIVNSVTGRVVTVIPGAP
ncbi:MAG: DUF4258 domain-containing protein [Azoarcus sp.]|jgi:hypothetical protein|nr:DUF4258 domain-containing protein [Azoarcus sp.]